jgi:SAM-dependent methyltransferase
MRQIDYDVEQYQHYTVGRALSERQLQIWISGFAGMLPRRRPLAGLDVGSGTGRFTPALAQAFGPVTGIEPSARMREIAQAQAPHADVRYVAGSAERMPMPSGSADYALMFPRPCLPSSAAECPDIGVRGMASARRQLRIRNTWNIGSYGDRR